MRKAYIVTVALFALAFSLASASDPDPLQDFCVALKDYSDSKSAGTFLFHFQVLALFLSCDESTLTRILMEEILLATWPFFFFFSESKS